MKPRYRQILAAIAGLVFVLLGFVIAFVGQFVVAAVGDSLVAAKSVPDWTLPQQMSSFYVFLVLGLCIAAGLSVTALLWSPRPGYSVRLAVYVLLLEVLLPVAVFNYAHADYLVNRGAQAVLNVFLVFGGAVVVTELFLLRPPARDLLVLQVLAVLSLSFTAVLVPATFSVVWLLNAFGVVSETGAKALGIPAVSTVSGVLAAMMAYIKFRREIKVEERPPTIAVSS